MSLEKLEARDRAADAALLSERILRQVTGQQNAPTHLSHAEAVDAIEAAFGAGQAVAWNMAAQRRTCRVCGCWEMEACDGGCWWVEDDLCSACEPEA
ncbi:MAG: hypothetical protein JWQ97_2921 [Phenylobacterium sp.]|nr:hypothetical protein [Phenylobacterium sp.]